LPEIIRKLDIISERNSIQIWCGSRSSTWGAAPGPRFPRTCGADAACARRETQGGRQRCGGDARGRAKAWSAGTRRAPRRAAGGGRARGGPMLGVTARWPRTGRRGAGVWRTAKATGLPVAASWSRRPAGARSRHGGPRTAAAAWWRPSGAPRTTLDASQPALRRRQRPPCIIPGAAQLLAARRHSKKRSPAAALRRRSRNDGWGTLGPSPAAPGRWLIAEGTRREAPRGTKRQGGLGRRGWEWEWDAPRHVASGCAL
jgi:hypothetical protein